MEGESRAYLKPVSQNMSGMHGLNLMHAVLKVDQCSSVVSQARVSAFRSSAASGAVVDSKSMTQWLNTSFSGLPSDRHRHMFLDTAILLHGQPLRDLRCAWIAMVQFDDDLADDPDTAACIVSDCLAELVTSSLVSINDDRHEEDSQEDMPDEATQRCVHSAVMSVLIALCSEGNVAMSASFGHVRASTWQCR